MRKSSALVRIIAYFVLIVVLLVVMISGMRGDGFGISCSIGGAYHFDNEDKYSIGEFSLDEEITAVDIDWISGKVNIVVTDDDKVSAKETDVDDEADELRYRVVDGKLMIKFKKPERFTFDESLKKTLTLYIPKDMAEDMKYMNISCVSANCSMMDVNVDEFVVEMVSGDIYVENANIDKVDVQSVSGSTKIEGTIGELNAESVSGKIEITSNEQLSKIDMESVSGKMIVNMPEGDGFTAEMDSVSGKLSIGFLVTSKGDKRINGDGSAEYNFESISGTIELNKID